MKTLLLVCIMLLTSVLYAQIPIKKTLVADETWVVVSGKSAFRVITTNDDIYEQITKEFRNKMYRITSDLKEDRTGKYWETSLYFKNEWWNDVVLFIKRLANL